MIRKREQIYKKQFNYTILSVTNLKEVFMSGKIGSKSFYYEQKFV